MLIHKCLVIGLFVMEVVGELPKFRVLAPQFVCPKDEDAVVDKPDNTVITIQTSSGASLRTVWSVRWTLLPAPRQRFTLMLWKCVRNLEVKLNRPQTEPLVYVIDNSELLLGVNYIFNVTVLSPEGEMAEPQMFHIDNTLGDTILEIEGWSEKLSVVLVGSETAHADREYELEAQVTACYPTHNYYFSWTVTDLQTNEQVDVSHITGSRLFIPTYTLSAGHSYDVGCQVLKRSSEPSVITQTGLQFQVEGRGLEAYLNVDYLIVTSNSPFFLETTVISHDNYNQLETYKWQCKRAEELCDSFESVDNSTLNFPTGLLETGLYEITVFVSVVDQTTSANAIIEVVDNFLPIIQIDSIPRILNEGTAISLVASASNVAPACNLTWYFAAQEELQANEEHGKPLTDTVMINSLEENFLNELSDFTNDTEWRQVSVEINATTGRARFVIQCGCSLTFDCTTQGLVYADVSLQVNKSPKPYAVMVSPGAGTAMETLFRISTLGVQDPDTPLKYSFYCNIGEDDILLGSNYDYLAVETFLPYAEAGIPVWVEVCDALGACSRSLQISISLSPGDARTSDALIASVLAHIRRCELLELQRDAMSAIYTYTNAGQTDALSKFTKALLESLPTADQQNCVMKHPNVYAEFLHSLQKLGLNVEMFLE